MFCFTDKKYQMAIPTWLLLCVLASAATAFIFDNEVPNYRNKDSTLVDFSRAFDALQHALRFMERNMHDLNLDAIIGTRIVSGKDLPYVADAVCICTLTAFYFLRQELSENCQIWKKQIK